MENTSPKAIFMAGDFDDDSRHHRRRHGEFVHASSRLQERLSLPPL